MTVKILLVDDEPYTAALFAGLLRGRPVTLEVAVTPQLLGRPLLEQRLPDVPFAIAWQGDDPMPELDRSDSRYCGTATLVHREQGEPPVAPAS